MTLDSLVREPDVDKARRVAVQGRARGLAFVQRNEWRRAEAVFSGRSARLRRIWIY